MLKIVAFLIFSITLAISGVPAPDAIIGNKIQDVNKQQAIRKIDTQKEYNDFIRDMKAGMLKGEDRLALYLGTLYMQDIKLKSGKTIKADLKLAKEYLRYAYNKGVAIAAFYLSMLEDKNDAVLDLKRALNFKNTSNEIKQLLAIRYAEIILNTNLYKNKTLISNAIEDILPISLHNDNPVLDFELAHLYYAEKKLNIANKFLNSSCNNPKAPKGLLAMCINDPYVQARNKNGNIIRKADVIKDTSTPFSSACMQKYNLNYTIGK